MTVQHIFRKPFSTVNVHAVIGKNEPFLNNTISSFTFNEIGLKTADDLLLTHVTFTPITKPADRLIEILYSIMVTIGPDIEFLRLVGVAAQAQISTIT
jgi:hypothetical protein